MIIPTADALNKVKKMHKRWLQGLLIPNTHTAICGNYLYVHAERHSDKYNHRLRVQNVLEAKSGSMVEGVEPPSPPTPSIPFWVLCGSNLSPCPERFLLSCLYLFATPIFTKSWISACTLSLGKNKAGTVIFLSFTTLDGSQILSSCFLYVPLKATQTYLPLLLFS